MLWFHPSHLRLQLHQLHFGPWFCQLSKWHRARFFSVSQLLKCGLNVFRTRDFRVTPGTSWSIPSDLEKTPDFPLIIRTARALSQRRVDASCSLDPVRNGSCTDPFLEMNKSLLLTPLRTGGLAFTRSCAFALMHLRSWRRLLRWTNARREDFSAYAHYRCARVQYTSKGPAAVSVFRSEPNPRRKSAWAPVCHWFEGIPRPAPFSKYPSSDAPIWQLTATAGYTFSSILGMSEYFFNISTNWIFFSKYLYEPLAAYH